jgi:hypothetical protein
MEKWTMILPPLYTKLFPDVSYHKISIITKTMKLKETEYFSELSVSSKQYNITISTTK